MTVSSVAISMPRAAACSCARVFGSLAITRCTPASWMSVAMP